MNLIKCGKILKKFWGDLRSSSRKTPEFFSEYRLMKAIPALKWNTAHVQYKFFDNFEWNTVGHTRHHFRLERIWERKMKSVTWYRTIKMKRGHIRNFSYVYFILIAPLDETFTMNLNIYIDLRKIQRITCGKPQSTCLGTKNGQRMQWLSLWKQWM